MAVLAVGCGIVVSSVTTRYRDLSLLVGFGLTLWQYASPVAYGLTLVPEGWRGLYMLNPMAPVIAAFRRAAFGSGWFDLPQYLLGWAVSLAVFLVGLVMFGRVERTFMDTI